MNPQIAPGVFDIIPKYAITKNEAENWRASHLWNFVENLARKTATEFGFEEIRTPIFERTELFLRGVGETSDIVSKEMYTFQDKGNRSMSLRPEGTAPVVRAFLDNNMQQTSPPYKLFYIGPMFRYERAQAGRYRQHHQFGAEAIGSEAPEQDVEIISMVYTLYSRLGLKNLKVSINSIGDTNCRIDYKKALLNYLQNFRDQLSEESQIRFDSNPLRILDSKDPKDKEITAKAPSILDFLKPDCQKHFNQIQALLKAIHLPFEVTPSLVRGLDYYNKTVFEIVSGDLGAQNSIAGGGRYDGLLKTLGGPDLPATGFATGLERVIQVMLKQKIQFSLPPRQEVFIISLGEESKIAGFSLLHHLRQKGISATMDFSDRKIAKIMQYANETKAEYVVVIGENELKTGQIELKQMSTGEKRPIPLKHLAAILSHEKQNEAFIKSIDELTKPYEFQEEAEYFIKKLDLTINETNKATEKLKNAIQSIQEMLD